MKKVSFSVTKAIKEAGYPKEWNDCEYYYTEIGELKRSDDYEGNSVEDIMYYQRYAVPASYAMEVWLWLWREKNIVIEPVYCKEGWTVLTHGVQGFFGDPEEAIIAAIEYLVDNDLIK